MTILELFFVCPNECSITALVGKTKIILSIWWFPMWTRFYNNAAKIFGAEDVLCRRLENLGRNLVYKACGSGCIITTSAWVYFFEKSFRVPKIVPKVLSRACVYYITRTISVNKVFIFCLLFSKIVTKP